MANEQRLIDANEAYKIARSSGLHNDFGKCMADLTSLKELLEDCTTVDAVEVVHGRWMHKGAWHIECSECHYIIAHIGEAKNYCPNCGAKMDGGNEDGS